MEVGEDLHAHGGDTFYRLACFMVRLREDPSPVFPVLRVRGSGPGIESPMTRASCMPGVVAGSFPYASRELCRLLSGAVAHAAAGVRA